MDVLTALLYMVAFTMVIISLVMTVYLVTRTAPAIAEIKANADVRKARIEARADLALTEDGYSEKDEDAEPSSLDMFARLAGYTDLQSAITDPNLISKLSGILGVKKSVNEVIE